MANYMPVGQLDVRKPHGMHRYTNSILKNHEILVSKKELYKADVQNCAFSLGSVGRISGANLGAKLSKLCKARSRICSLHERERERERERDCK
jgi:hypothetical protein